MVGQTVEKTVAKRGTVEKDVQRYVNVMNLWSAWDSREDGYADLFEQKRSFCEMMILEGLQVLQNADLADLELRTASFQAVDAANAEARSMNTYRQWLATAKNVMRFADQLAEAGVAVEAAEPFREAIAGVESIFLDDDVFFAGDKLQQLRDAAIDDHRAGQCEPLCE